ncbi:hypothetical protein ACUNV4_23105 [Granulosicoccus sp. 3-233]|uniref:hypothetical protein n=1 Tax=Granulosicoccus sp. 3-233 TaxID=3417969 RepID=UPI003D355909
MIGSTLVATPALAAIQGLTIDGLNLNWSANTAWMQVQNASNYQSVCEGVISSCTVPMAGTYHVINHTNGNRSDFVEATGDNGNTGATTVSVVGNTINWPNDGWYQVQSADDYSSLCQGGTQCEVPDGTYIVINHTTGHRYEDIVVPQQSASFFSVDGNTITFNQSGWMQVQSASDYTSLCEGSDIEPCTVPDGIYNIINHTTGQRTENIEIAEGGSGEGPIMPDGFLVRSDADNLDWDAVDGADSYVVQRWDGTPYQTVTDATDLVGVEAGDYRVVATGSGAAAEAPESNLVRILPGGPYSGDKSSRQADDDSLFLANIDYPSPDVWDGDLPGVAGERVITSDNYSDIIAYVFSIVSGSAYGPAMLDLPSTDDNPIDSHFDVLGTYPLAGVITEESCDNQGLARFIGIDWGVRQITNGWDREFGECQQGDATYQGQHMQLNRGNRLNLSNGFVTSYNGKSAGFAGTVHYKHTSDRDGGPGTYYLLSDVTYSTTGTEDPVLIDDANVEYLVTYGRAQELRADLTITSATTAWQPLSVLVDDDMIRDDIFESTGYDYFDRGTLTITGADGSVINLDADTGDISTVQVSVSNDVEELEIELPWSTWSEQLEFRFDLLGSAE